MTDHNSTYVLTCWLTGLLGFSAGTIAGVILVLEWSIRAARRQRDELLKMVKEQGDMNWLKDQLGE